MRLPIATPAVTHTVLAGRTVLITGGSAGIGRSVVELCLREGALVSTIARRPVEGIASERLLHVAGDLRDRQAIDRWLARTAEVTPQIDALVNNAAALDGDVRDVFEVTAFAAHELIARLADRMRPRGWIVNVTSDLSLVPAPDHVAYAAAKAALNSLTLSWAARLRGTGVVVNALHPGHISTTLDPAGRDRPEIVWPMMLSLLSCEASTTGRFFTHTGELGWFGT